MFFVVSEQFGGGAPAEFLEFLRQLARDAQLSILENIDRSFERFRQPIGRFEINRRFLSPGRGTQFAFAPAALHREKSTEEKFLTGKSRPDERGENRGRSGNNCEIEFSFNAFA